MAVSHGNEQIRGVVEEPMVKNGAAACVHGRYGDVDGSTTHDMYTDYSYYSGSMLTDVESQLTSYIGISSLHLLILLTVIHPRPLSSGASFPIQHSNRHMTSKTP